MNDKNSWELLDSAVSNPLVEGASIFERVELLEKIIYGPDSPLLRLLPRKKKNLSGLNGRAHQAYERKE